jgi:hypothetical protein
MSRGSSRGCCRFTLSGGLSETKPAVEALVARKPPFDFTPLRFVPLRAEVIIMENIGRFLMIGGIIFFVVGGLIFLAAKFGIPFGRLPGDIRIERDGFSFYFPLASSILISILLTIILNLLARFFKK